MNDVLIRIILRFVAFLELSGAPDVNPDAAVRELEGVAAMLQELNQHERDALVAFARQEAKTATDPAYRDFLLSFPKNVGLV